MPNWCHNELTVEGSEEELGRFHDAHARTSDDGDPEFTFQGSAPRPKVLGRIVSGGCTIDGEKVNTWVERDGKPVRIADRTLAFLAARYGAVNWYDWSVKNWGVKWDAGEAAFDASPGRRTYSFATAWGPPAEWARTASAAFPGLSLRLDYDESGMGFAGTLEVAGGATLVDESREYDGE